MELLIGDIKVILAFLEEHNLHLQEGTQLLPSDLYLIDKLDGPVGIFPGQTHEECWAQAKKDGCAECDCWIAAFGFAHRKGCQLIWTMRQKET